MKSRTTMVSLLLIISAVTTFAQGWQQLWGALPQFSSVSAVNDSTCWISGERAFVVLVTNRTKINWRGAGESAGLEPGMISAIYGRSDQLAWAGSGDGKIYRTTDGGLTWVKQFQHTAGAAAFFNGFHFWDDNVGIAWGDPVTSPGPFLIMRTTNGGTTWTELTSGLPQVTSQYGISGRHDVVGDHLFFPSTANADSTVARKLIYTTDRGVTWNEKAIPTNFGNFSVSFSDPLNGLITDDTGIKIARTTNGGNTWTVRYDGVGATPLKFLKGTSSVWIQGRFDAQLGYRPIFFSSDFGTTWTRQLKSTPVSLTNFSVVSNNVVWGCGFNYLILRTTNGGVSTSVAAEEGIASVPLSLELSQNFPNPFNPETSIKYRLEASGTVRLIIYDMLGHQVRVLVDGEKPAGWHLAVWDGLNDRRQAVSTGTYFYRIVSNGRAEAKQMLLLR